MVLSSAILISKRNLQQGLQSHKERKFLIAFPITQREAHTSRRKASQLNKQEQSLNKPHYELQLNL